MNFRFLTNYGEFSYDSREMMIERFHFLCWWIEFYWTSSELKHYVTPSDHSEYKTLKDYFHGKCNDRVFSPKSIFDYI